jgi:signal peptidase II
MLYFPIIDTTFPDSFPIWGGQRFQFFRPVFNISDAAISTGVITLLLFHRRIFKSKPASTEHVEDNELVEKGISPVNSFDQDEAK